MFTSISYILLLACIGLLFIRFQQNTLVRLYKYFIVIYWKYEHFRIQQLKSNISCSKLLPYVSFLLGCIISQKNLILRNTAVRTSNIANPVCDSNVI